MSDVIRVLRLVEYIGPRAAVEEQIEKSIHGVRRIGDSQQDGHWVRIRATTLGEAAEILSEAEAEAAKQSAAQASYPGQSPSPLAADSTSVRLFVGAKCGQRNGSVVTITSKNDWCKSGGVNYPFLSSGGHYYTEGGTFTTVEGESPWDIIRVLNPEDHPDHKEAPGA